MSIETLRRLLTLREAIKDARDEFIADYGEQAEFAKKFAEMKKLEIEISKRANEWDAEDS